MNNLKEIQSCQLTAERLKRLRFFFYTITSSFGPATIKNTHTQKKVEQRKKKSVLAVDVNPGFVFT